MDLAGTIGRLRALLDEAVRSESCDGVLLSGGLDTSIVAFLGAKHVPGLKAFTVTMEGFDDDAAYATIVARFLGLDHRVHAFTRREALEAAEEAADILHGPRHAAAVPQHISERVIEGYSEGVGLVTLAPMLIAMKFAAKRVDSIYSGDGADELLVGYDSVTSFLDYIASSGDEAFAAKLEREMSSRVFLAHDLSYPYLLASASGMRLSAPFLNERVSRFARELPVEYKVRREGGRAWGKWLLRKAFEDYLPPEIIWREKTTIDVGTGATRALGQSSP